MVVIVVIIVPHFSIPYQPKVSKVSLRFRSLGFRVWGLVSGFRVEFGAL